MQLAPSLLKPAIISAALSLDFRMDDLRTATLVVEGTVDEVLTRGLPENKFPASSLDVLRIRPERVLFGRADAPFTVAVFTIDGSERFLDIGPGRGVFCCFGRYDIKGHPEGSVQVARILDERYQDLADLMARLPSAA